MARDTWLYWWPMRGEKAEDAHEHKGAPHRDADLVVRDVAQRDWSRSGDYWTEESLVVVDPFGARREYAIEVESVPHFNIRQRPGPAQSSGKAGGA